MKIGRWSSYAVLSAVTAACGLALAVAVATLGDPARTRFTMQSAGLWPVAGPHVVLLSLAGVGLGLCGWRYGPRPLAVATAVIAVASLVASATFTVAIARAVLRAGGSVNVARALALGSMAAPPDRRAVFTTVGGRPMRALIYAPSPGRAAPVLLYIHGGGWVTGNAASRGRDMRWFSDRGWLVLSIEYPLATHASPTWDVAPKVVACGLTWAMRNARRYGGDPRRVVVTGDSAGGNLAINLAYAAASGRAVSSCGGTVPAPRAVVVQYPLVDPLAAYDHGSSSVGVGPKGFVTTYLGGAPARFPKRVAAIASASYLSRRAPQTLVIEPEKDGLVPSASVFRFIRRARSAGVAITVAPIPWANHAYDASAAGSLGDQAHLTITAHYLAARGLAPNEH